MKTFKTLLFGTIIGLSALSANAQNPTIPAASPAASVSQTFGLTKIDITYSSPGVKGRQIWGGLVPYDSVWRTGANACTTIEFSTDVKVGGQAVKKGKYGLFTIPGRNSWTVIINSDATQWGAYDYKKSLDVVRFSVSAQPSDMKERMVFTVDALSDTSAMINIAWEKLKVSFGVTANTLGMVKSATENTWRTLINSSKYYVDNKLDLKKAQEWAQTSVNMKEHFYNRYIMALVLKAQGNNAEALKYATEAKTIGDKVNDDFYKEYKDDVAKLIADLGGAKK